MQVLALIFVFIEIPSGGWPTFYNPYCKIESMKSSSRGVYWSWNWAKLIHLSAVTILSSLFFNTHVQNNIFPDLTILNPG